jgi:hypothetical protein
MAFADALKHGLDKRWMEAYEAEMAAVEIELAAIWVTEDQTVIARWAHFAGPASSCGRRPALACSVFKHPRHAGPVPMTPHRKDLRACLVGTLGVEGSTVAPFRCHRFSLLTLLRTHDAVQVISGRKFGGEKR